MAHGKHTAKIVVDSTCKDAAENNPEVGSGAKLRAHNGTKDGTCSGNVEKLNHKDLPRRHYDVVHSVGLSHGGRWAVVGGKDAFYNASIEQISEDKSYQTDDETYHIFCLFVIHSQKY